MFEMNKEKFGMFVAELRKEKGITQKELAQKLFISDKAVSKWECGISMPDISLLAPLAGMLGVTVTELLDGERVDLLKKMDMEHVEALVSKTIKLSEEEQKTNRQHGIQRIFVYTACVFIVVLEITLLLLLGYTRDELSGNILLIEVLYLIFGAWFWLGAKEHLPAYYDENKICFYSDGIFRMNIPGISFNNSNWPHIVRICRIWTMTVAVIYPLLFLLVSYFRPSLWGFIYPAIIFIIAFSLFIPIYSAGKKYQ